MSDESLLFSLSIIQKVMQKTTSEIKNQAEVNVSLAWMLFFSFVVGIVASFGAIIFKAMIGFIHNLTFSGKLSIYYNANLHPTKSIWGLGIILVPVVGSVVVTWLTQKFASEARGHGVPEVMDAIYYKEGKIRPIVAFVKAISSSISIGTGGSVGREGPIVQIGSAFGSFLGQIIKMNTRQRIVLIAAGAAAGISATFNTPIGGLAFAIELLLVTISAANVVIVVIATVTATIISNFLSGIDPAFNIPHLTPLAHALNPVILILFIPFGVIAGAVAALFIHSIYWMEDRSAELIKNPYFRHMAGMFVLGVILYLMMRFAGQYYVAGVGYATILDVLKGILTNPLFLLFLCLLKILSTSLTLGTGASGGVFSPSLFVGATLGATFGGVLNYFFPSLHIPILLFPIAGMAAMVGGSTGAIVTAITMTFEQTRDYADILPIMLSVALTYFVRIKITTESIYTLKLYRRGLSLPQGLQAGISTSKRACHFMEKSFSVINMDEITGWIQQQSGEATPQCAIIHDNNQVVGVIRRELNYLISDIDPQNLIDKNFTFASEKTTWPMIMREMANTNVILIYKYGKSKTVNNIVGFVTRHEIFKSSQEIAKLLE